MILIWVCGGGGIGEIPDYAKKYFRSLDYPYNFAKACLTSLGRSKFSCGVGG